MRLGLLLGCLLAGVVHAGQSAASPPATATATAPATTGTPVWVATYRLREGERERRFVLVRGDDRLEYRIDGEPVRVWQRGTDGLQHREVFVAQGQVVSYHPGDLRALGQDVEWARLATVIDPAVRGRLQPAGSAASPARLGAGGRVQRFRGDLDGIAIALDWLDGAMLPTRYRSGRGAGRVELELLELQRQPQAQAFTATDGLRELDYADLGDMPHDAFARRYLQYGVAPKGPAGPTPANGAVLPGVAAPVAPWRAGGGSPATRHTHTHH